MDLVALIQSQGIGVAFAIMFYIDMRGIIKKNTEAIQALCAKEGVSYESGIRSSDSANN